MPSVRRTEVDPRKLIGRDERLVGICAYCGGVPSTRDHVPSRVLLDEPFPPNLPVVEACEPCNASFSSSELYVASLIECVLAGSADPRTFGRPKIAERLAQEPSLASMLEASYRPGEFPCWQPDQRRLDQVILKLAQGHAAWELTLPAMDEPESLRCFPIVLMSASQLAAFEMPPSAPLLPELGSRAFYDVLKSKPGFGWRVVQEGRYRYCVDQDEGVGVRIVLSEYLACMVTWQ